MARLSPKDPSSFARPDFVLVQHLKLVLEVKFKHEIFAGFVELSVLKIDENATKLILDVKDLHITSIIEQSSQLYLDYQILLDSKTCDIGSQLIIDLQNCKEKQFVIKIDYSTNPSASGLQWLAPEQTSGKVHPYVFSQFQAIAARSFVPCQDTPSVKCTYEAEITCPKELKVVMSALQAKNPICSGSNATFYFKQGIPIQSYLIALAIGALESRKLGPRTVVHAEKEIIMEATYEFELTEELLQTAESICGPYVWTNYDLLVLPPSFPFGGMENPCLTFLTPTLLAGDRSLVNVVSHEIAHSWTGNLVTNANFEHFWLNEGFTVFIERKILGRRAGKAVQDFDAYKGLSILKETVFQLGKTNKFTNLVPDLTGVHPDEAFSSIPYEKGHVFLRYLENLVGGSEVFESFLREYLDHFKNMSITTEDFQLYFNNYFSDVDVIKTIDWNSWLNMPGMPPVIPEYDNSIMDLVKKKKIEYLNWDVNQNNLFVLNIDDMSSEEKIQLLQEILESGPQPIAKLEVWDKAWQLFNIKNAEIKYRWLRICISSKWEKVVQIALDWINLIGRMKYTRPIYRDLYAWEEFRPKCIENFLKNKSSMMHVSVFTISKDLHLT